LTAIGAAGIHRRAPLSSCGLGHPRIGRYRGRLILTRRANQQNPVQPLSQKYSDFPKTQITLYPRLSCPTEGRLEIVTDAGQDAVDASGAKDEGAFLADGEVVWS
jgi:hypothetical protein